MYVPVHLWRIFFSIPATLSGEVMEMGPSFSPSGVFRACLRSDQAAARFYDSCTAQQRSAIEHQLQMLRSEQEVRHFTAYLPSAAL